MVTSAKPLLPSLLDTPYCFALHRCPWYLIGYRKETRPEARSRVLHWRRYGLIGPVFLEFTCHRGDKGASDKQDLTHSPVARGKPTPTVQVPQTWPSWIDIPWLLQHAAQVVVEISKMAAQIPPRPSYNMLYSQLYPPEH